VLLLGVTLLGSDSSSPKEHIRNYLLYLPMFGVGAVMAHHHQSLSRIGHALTRTRGALMSSLGVFLLTLSWTARDQSTAIYRSLALLGAALIVFAFGYWNPMRSVGETPLLQWLGRRSFSLYLVHFPIVIATAILLGSLSRFTFMIAIPLSLLAAHVFFRLVEGPSHRFSQAVKARVASGSKGLGPAPVAPRQS
jgi:peptidoglycan/LPS O-acetylase OafA/YrhL